MENGEGADSQSFGRAVGPDATTDTGFASGVLDLPRLIGFRSANRRLALASIIANVATALISACRATRDTRETWAESAHCLVSPASFGIPHVEGAQRHRATAAEAEKWESSRLCISCNRLLVC